MSPLRPEAAAASTLRQAETLLAGGALAWFDALCRRPPHDPCADLDRLIRRSLGAAAVSLPADDAAMPVAAALVRRSHPPSAAGARAPAPAGEPIGTAAAVPRRHSDPGSADTAFAPAVLPPSAPSEPASARLRPLAVLAAARFPSAAPSRLTAAAPHTGRGNSPPETASGGLPAAAPFTVDAARANAARIHGLHDLPSSAAALDRPPPASPAGGGAVARPVGSAISTPITMPQTATGTPTARGDVAPWGSAAAPGPAALAVHAFVPHDEPAPAAVPPDGPLTRLVSGLPALRGLLQSALADSRQRHAPPLAPAAPASAAAVPPLATAPDMRALPALDPVAEDILVDRLADRLQERLREQAIRHPGFTGGLV